WMREAPRAARRSAPRPAASAASSQPRSPTPVRTTVASGGAAISARVRSSSVSSSTCGIVDIAAAGTTRAPCRSRAAASSSERRSTAVMTVRPARAPESRVVMARRSPSVLGAHEALVPGLLEHGDVGVRLEELREGAEAEGLLAEGGVHAPHVGLHGRAVQPFAVAAAAELEGALEQAGGRLAGVLLALVLECVVEAV